MPSKTYYLDAAKTESLTAKWGMFFRNVEVLYNGQSLGTVPSKQALEQGYEFSLPDGRSLVAQLTRSVYQQELELRLSGKPVPGSATDPRERLKQAWYVLLFIGGLNLALGLVAVLQQVEILQSLGLGWGSVVEGLLYAGLGWWGYKRLASMAFAIAGVLFVLDGVLMIGASVSTGGNPGIGGLFMRFFLTVLIYRGYQAARHLRAQGQLAPSVG
jgi:hypothetical protein